MSDTIFSDSPLGKRLGKIRRTEARCLVFKGNKIPLAYRITIGRDRANDLIIDDNMVSRFHAVIQKIKSAYFIKDLRSRNGTSVNGVRVPKDRYIRLTSRDVIRIGRTDVTIS